VVLHTDTLLTAKTLEFWAALKYVQALRGKVPISVAHT
jgi:hypothetical protein